MLSSTPVQQAERQIDPASRRYNTEEENQGPQKKKPIPESESNRHSAQMRIQQSRSPAHRGGSTDPGLAHDTLGRKRKLRSRDKTDTKKRACNKEGESSCVDPLLGLCIRYGWGKEGPSSGERKIPDSVTQLLTVRSGRSRSAPLGQRETEPHSDTPHFYQHNIEAQHKSTRQHAFSWFRNVLLVSL